MKKYLLLILAPAFIAGCAQTTPYENTASTTSAEVTVLNDGHTAENALDWIGVYEGVFPCADCEGINTRLTLKWDHTYILEESYIKNGAVAHSGKREGRFSFDSTYPSLIRLDMNANQRVFFVGENYVQQRDQQTGESLSADLPYTLYQISN